MTEPLLQESAREGWLRLGRFDLRLVFEREPFAVGLMLYGLRSRTPQAWLHLSNGPVER